MGSNIPILNIYYLLSYAWDRLDQAGIVDVGKLEGNNISDLMAHVLIGGAQRLLKEGLDQGYIEQTEELALLRGAINFDHSISRGSKWKAKAVCQYEDFNPVVLQNQILRTTLRKLANVNGVDPILRNDLIKIWRRMADIPEIEIVPSLFRKLQFNRNKSVYIFLMDICRLVHECLLPSKYGNEYRFRNFTEDEVKMRLLFQHFVRKFYDRNLPQFKITADQLKWDAIAEHLEDYNLLPIMETDIVIRSDIKTWVIDTKFYRDTLGNNEGANKIHSGHLYQMFAYLKNIEKKGRGIGDAAAEGILLYPVTTRELDGGYMIQGHRIRICTVNLMDEWKQIHERLLEIVKN